MLEELGSVTECWASGDGSRDQNLPKGDTKIGAVEPKTFLLRSYNPKQTFLSLENRVPNCLRNHHKFSDAQDPYWKASAEHTSLKFQNEQI